MRMTRSTFLVACCVLIAFARPAAAQSGDGIGALLDDLQRVLERGDGAAYARLFVPGADPETVARLTEEVIAAGVTRAVVRERDRGPLVGTPEGSGHRLIVDVFTELDRRGRVSTHRLDVRRLPAPPGSEGDEEGVWRIAAQERLSMVDGLHRLVLDVQKQLDVRNLTVTAEDLTLTLPSGSAFAASFDGGVTALVLLGSGTLRFAPRPVAEQGQLRIFSGREVLETRFDEVFLRLNPDDFETLISTDSIVERTPDNRTLGRAREVFDAEVAKSFSLDLSDLSRQTWSLVPSPGDLLAEIRTKKYRTLTYARSSKEPEDITLFDRATRRNIAVYPSLRKLESRGRFYDEDAQASYDILEYDVSAAFTPEREWIEGRVRFRLRVRDFQAANLSFRLQESLYVRAVIADGFGRLLALRVKGQNSVIVSLPQAVPRDSLITLTVIYSGRLPPQQFEREAEVAAGEAQAPSAATAETSAMTPEPRFMYSSRSWWYPQSPFSDYATASLRITVPVEYDVVASGSPAADNPRMVGSGAPGDRRRHTFVFTAGQPLRYLAVIVSKLTRAAEATIPVEKAPANRVSGDPSPGGASLRPDESTPGHVRDGVYYDALDIAVVANPRQLSKGRSLLDQTSQIMSFYTGLLEDSPYPSFTLALVDSDKVGGHSPAYWAVLCQVLPGSQITWGNDPVSFDSFPQFFLAHELAHQFWGHAIGWKSYHEQWISEGFAQYFAALYAERFRGPVAFRDLLRQMRRWALEKSGEGPIHLGYRLGHIRGETPVFRAVVYNKGAMVLHMLRRLLGDEAFFRGLRTLYHSSRFSKVGTDDVQRAFETVTGRRLDRFFQQWVLDAAIPEVVFSYTIDGPATQATASTDPAGPANGVVAAEARLRFEQVGEPFDIPITVTITYRTGEREEVVVPVSDRSVEQRVPLRGPVRRLEVNADHGALARIVTRKEG